MTEKLKRISNAQTKKSKTKQLEKRERRKKWMAEYPRKLLKKKLTKQRMANH